MLKPFCKNQATGNKMVFTSPPLMGHPHWTLPKFDLTFKLVHLVQRKNLFELQNARIAAVDLFTELSNEDGGFRGKVQPKANQPNV